MAIFKHPLINLLLNNSLLPILPLAVLQLTVLPMLLPVFDLLTVWVIISAITLGLARSLLIAALVALILETHTVAPLGLYFCAYWSLIISIYLCKGVVAWNMRISWLVTVALGELWIIFLETLAVDTPNLYPYTSTCLLRLVSSILLVAWFSSPFMKNVSVDFRSKGEGDLRLGPDRLKEGTCLKLRR